MELDQSLSDLILFDSKVVEKPRAGVLLALRGYMSYKDKKNDNERGYPGDFWNWVVNLDYVQRHIKNFTLFGEFEHPFSGNKVRTPFIDPSLISHCCVDVEVDDVGVLATVCVLDTPMGRIVKTLLDFGAKLGVSTRAFGEEVLKGKQNGN